MSEEKQNLFAPRHIVSQFNLDEIVIPYGITDIGDYALYKCNTLKSVEFPSGGLKSIGQTNKNSNYFYPKNFGCVKE